MGTTLNVYKMIDTPIKNILESAEGKLFNYINVKAALWQYNISISPYQLYDIAIPHAL